MERNTQRHAVHLNGDEKTPFYATHAITGSKEILRIFMNSLQKKNTSQTCTDVPYKCERDATFLINMSYIKKQNDILADGLGSYMNQSGRKLYFNIQGKKISEVQEEGSHNCKIRTQHFKHKYHDDFRRRVTSFFYKSMEKPMYVVIVYSFLYGAHKINVQAHGNSKGPKPFTRTMPSVMDKVREDCGKKRYGEIYEGSFSDAGGLRHCTSTTKFARNMTQIYNIAKSTKGAQNTTTCLSSQDEMVKLLLMKDEEQSSIRFTHQTKDCNLLVTLATDFQLSALAKFCTGDKFSIFGADMTYNAGQFYVTPTTIRHPMLINTRSMVEPALLGPTIIHTQHNVNVYKAFAADLVNCDDRLKNIKYLGSDRQMEIYNGFKSHMPGLGHMLCKKHLEDNVSEYLSNKSVPGTERQKVLSDIFGYLACCKNEEEYEVSLSEVKRKWDKINVDLYPWFIRYQSNAFKRSMLSTERQRAGLGDKFFYNNANESVNKLIKDRVSRKTSLTEFVKHWESLSQEQQNNCERAMIGAGKYDVKVQFNYLKIDSSKWCTLSLKQRELAINRFMEGFNGETESNIRTKAKSTKSLFQVMTRGVNKNSGRKPQQTIRKRKGRSIASKYCSDPSKHNHVLLCLLEENSAITRCYHCQRDFDRRVIRVVATYRVKTDSQNVYVHLWCLNHSNLNETSVHICSYLQGVLTTDEINDITEHSKIDE